MNYQNGTGVVAGTSTTVAGVALLPTTGDTPWLMYVSVAAIVTGVTLIALQVGVWAYRRRNQ